jgi:hypothetical protein
MTKLSAWFAIAAVSLGLSAAGCRRAPEKEEVDTSGKPLPGPKGSAAPATPAPGGSGGGSSEAKPAEQTKPGELPAECNEYSAAMEKLASCSAIPETTRNALKQTYDDSAKSWAAMSSESKDVLAKACKGGADAVLAATASCK